MQMFDKPSVFAPRDRTSMRLTHPAAAARTAIATAILLVCLFSSPACSDTRQQRSGTQPAYYQLAASWSHSETQSSLHDDPGVRTRALLGQTSEDAAAIEAAAEVQQAIKREAAAQAEREAEEAEVAAEFAAGANSAADPAAAAEERTQLGSAVATLDGISINQAYKLLNATAAADPKLMKPLPAEGRAVMKRHRTCAAFFMRPLARIALVGNGPLTEAQRLEVAASDLVIRFNKMNNRFCGERVDVWLLRHAAEDAKLRWHGLGELAHCQTAEVLASSPVLWMFGGSAWWFNPYTVTAAAAAYPQIPKQLTWQGIPFAPWKNLYQAYVAPLGSPSTGWIGLMLALDCKPAGAALHLYGFNWSRRHWKSHAIAAEERFIRTMADLGRLEIHETACKGLRFCGACNVVAAGAVVAEAADDAAADPTAANVTVPCSPVQASSRGELTTEELLSREPEKHIADL